MSKVTFTRLYQHGDKTFRPHVEYDSKDIPEILEWAANPVVEKESPKKKSKGTSKK